MTTLSTVDARILVVEDDAIVARDIEGTLLSLGYDVCGIARDAQEALDLATGARPDLALMDVRLPGGRDGVEAGTVIREDLSIPVVYLTAHSDPRTLSRAKESGSYGYLVKPFDAMGLRAAIEVALYRHQMESMIRESEERYNATLQAIGDAVVATDAQGMVTFVNPAAEVLLGTPADALLGVPVGEAVTLRGPGGDVPGGRERVLNPVGDALASQEAVFLTGRCSVRTAGGTLRPVGGTVSLIRGVGGRIIGAVMALTDATMEREVERGLRERAAHYHRLYRGDVWASFSLDDGGKILECSEALAALLGVGSSEGMQGRSLRDFLPVPVEYEYLSALVTSAGVVLPHERALRRLDGASVHVVLTLRRETEDGPVIGRIVDLTERKRLAEHFEEVRRLEAVGRLAGGVAHSVNNLLTVIRGRAELIASSVPPEIADADAAEIIEATERAAELVRRLLAVGQRRAVMDRVVEAGDALRDMLPALSDAAGPGVLTVLELAPEPLWIRADPSFLSQAFKCLVSNARQAMPAGGRLVLGCHAVDVPPEQVANTADLHAGPYVVFTVSDSGMGMDEETRERALEPFFTTRRDATGLGLSTAFGLVRQEGGWLGLESRPGDGTTVYVYLPRTMPPVDGVHPPR